MEKYGIGRLGVALAALSAIAMCIISYIFHPVVDNIGSMSLMPSEVPQYGICLPSPDSWDFPPFWSWCVNTFLIGLIALLLFLVNSSYNFVRTTEPTLVAVFIIMAASSPWFTRELNTSVLLCLANVVCLGIILDSYQSRNATREMFTIGVVIGFGSMVQYAFLPMAMVFIIWALFMKVLRIKETLAFLAGLICPYWIALGTGWLPLSSLHFPALNPLFSYDRDPSAFILLLAAIGIAAIPGFMLTVINSIKLYAGNSKVNAMNLCVSTLGGASVVCILVDFDNMPSYVITLYMATAVQLANINALWNPRAPWMVTVIPALLYMAIFVCTIVL